MLKRAFLILAACAIAPAAAQTGRGTLSQAELSAAVAAPGRPEAALRLDEVRRPAEILRFMGLRRGDRVLDYFTGTGYYADIMARAVVEATHRIDPAVIRADFERAGFVLEAESNLLRNPQDNYATSVFDESIRGRTDRVVYRFRKPRR